ncbi:uncharacterized protein LOC106475142 [Limulus polyphemus]|uniref:Uncharacterized protein LOC106475142 n=1 Tax=Limulus polyphemus TaxID=6850 RepID=A0ABM1RUJ1_LIMPO|nr:uncharacterized protein LOC106475142 [Limulus polyphemus]
MELGFRTTQKDTATSGTSAVVSKVRRLLTGENERIQRSIAKAIHLFQATVPNIVKKNLSLDTRPNTRLPIKHSSQSLHTSSSCINEMDIHSIPYEEILIKSRDAALSAVCYFPAELQGPYVVQSRASPDFGGRYVTYSDVMVEVDSVTPWGRCHRRDGNNVILSENTRWKECMRCFHLTWKTPNFIQIHVKELDTCHTSEEEALGSCPNEDFIFKGGFTEIMLYRKQDHRSAFTIQNVFCPINGRFRFTFRGNNGNYRCDQPYPELSNCPHGNALEFRFHQCNFPDTSISYLCLGDWQGPNDDRFVALMDLSGDSDRKPKFRCGLYKQDTISGRVYLSLSEDSTCISGLRSSSDGYETFVLTPLPSRSLPAPVLSARCKFPSWLQGRWENLEVNGNKFIYEDHRRFQTLIGWCVTKETSTPFECYHIYTINQCGQEAYNCVWLQQRSRNVLELQLGDNPSSGYTQSLCRHHQFRSNTWVTLGRLDVTQPESCPITGNYSGVTSGGGTLCAKMATDCNNPDILHYSIRDCGNKLYSNEATKRRGDGYQHYNGRRQDHKPKQREYRCLGNWEENGVLYTYTQRRDSPGFQCFSGKVLRNGEEAYIKEVGQNCLRGEDPFLYGIKVTRDATCPLNPLTSYLPTRTPWRPSPKVQSPKQPLTVTPSFRPTRWPWNPPHSTQPTQLNTPGLTHERNRPPWRPYLTQRPKNDLRFGHQPTRQPWRPPRATQPPQKNYPPTLVLQTRKPWRPPLVSHPQLPNHGPNQHTRNSYQYPGRFNRYTTPSWRPITGRPRSRRNNKGVSSSSASYTLLLCCSILLFSHRRHIYLG